MLQPLKHHQHPPWHIEYLIIPKILYFLLNVLLYSTYTFTAKYLEEVWRITPHHFGYIIGLSALSFIGSLAWTWLVDACGKHRLILITASLAYALLFLSLRLEPLFKYASEGLRMIFVITAFGLSNYCSSALFPLLDNRVLVMLKGNPTVPSSIDLFGRQRLFGVLGHSFITLVNGHLIERYGFDAMFISILLSAIIFSIVVATSIPNSKTITNSPSTPNPTSSPSDNAHRLKLSLSSLLGNTTFTLFLLTILLAGTTRGVVGNYLPQFLEKSLCFSTSKISLMLQSRIITEIFIFFIAPNLLGKFGARWVLFLGQMAGLLRVLAYAALPYHPPWRYSALVVELLKGISNACIVSGGVRLVYELSQGTGLSAMAQGFFSGTHSYLANALSGFFGGIILQVNQTCDEPFRRLFLTTTGVSILGIIIFLVALCFDRYKRAPEKSPD